MKLYEGYRMKLLQNEILVLMCFDDTLGQYLWKGFKGGVRVSKQKCRHCYCKFNDMQIVVYRRFICKSNKIKL